jgi:hypothetical protein
MVFYHKKYLLIIGITLALLSSCKRNQQEGVVIIDADKKITKTLDDFISHIEIVPLETNKDALLQNYWKVIVYDDNYYVQDRSNGLYVFNIRGEYLYKIGNHGNGPGEYIYIADFQVNPFTGNIELLEPTGRIKVYSRAGEFLHHYGKRFQEVSYFYIIDEDLMLLSHNSFSPALDLYSRKADSVMKSFFSFDSDFMRFRPVRTDAHYYVYNDELYIHHGYTNVIYKLDNNQLQTVQELDFGSSTFTIDDYDWEFAMSDKEVGKDFIDRKYVYAFRDDFENDRYMIKKFCFRNDIRLLLYDKRKDEYEILHDLPACMRYFFGDARRYADYLNNELPGARETGTRLPQILNWDSGDEYVLGSINFQTKARYINPEILDEENLDRYNNIKPNDNAALVKIYFKQ